MSGHVNGNGMNGRQAICFPEFDPDEVWAGHNGPRDPSPALAEQAAVSIQVATIDPRNWQDKPVPVRKWVVPGLIPARTVTMFSGDGGGGKTLLMLQLSVTRCISALFLGQEPTRGRTLYLSAEDEGDELQRRLEAICRHYDCKFSDLSNLAKLSHQYRE